MLTLVLVRHGSHGLLGRVLAGRMPGVSLSEAGRAEAERTAALLAGRGIARVLSSPLERTRETAEIVAGCLGLDVEIAEEINEIDCGDWTGADFARLPEHPLWHSWNHERATCAMPGGESMAAVQARALDLVARLAAGPGDQAAGGTATGGTATGGTATGGTATGGTTTGGTTRGGTTVALVTHSDVVKAIAMAALGLSLDRHDHLVVDPASVTTLQVFGDYMRVVRLNEAAA